MEETVKILRFDTGQAVKSLADLKEYIKQNKDALNDLEIGTEAYNAQLRKVQEGQDALRDSMNYGQKTITAANGSYNDLVHTMRELKQEWRSTNDEAKRSQLGDQIAVINSQLKQLDASVGNYSRQVGDYRNAMMEVSVLLDGKAKKAFDNTNKALGALSKNPVMGAFTLLLPVIVKMADALKENETATKAFDKALEALKPVFDMLDKAIETLAGWISTAVDYFVDLSKGSGDTFKSIISGAVGVGNVILQYLLTPVRTVIEAFKGLGNIVKDVFTGQFKDIKQHAADALSGVTDAVKKGFSIKDNFEAGKKVGEEFIDGLGSTKKKAKEAAKGVASAAKEELDKTLEYQKDILTRELSLMDGYNAARLAKERELRAKQHEIAVKSAKESIKDADILAQTLELMEAQYQKDLIAIDRKYADKAIEEEHQRLENKMSVLKEGSAEYLAAAVELRKYELETLAQADGETEAAFEARRIEAQKALQEALTEQTNAAIQAYNRDIEAQKAALEAQRALMKAKIAQWQGYAGLISSLATSMADAYEGMSKDQEKAAERTKGIRIAAATIDTISGAVAAFMSAMEAFPAPYNLVAGALSAATVTATGVAQIAKIRSTNTKGGSTSGISSTPAQVSAPAVIQQVPVTRSLTSQTEEERLDKMASDQRVVLVYSDVEKADKYVEVVNEETAFGG